MIQDLWFYSSTRSIPSQEYKTFMYTIIFTYMCMHCPKSNPNFHDITWNLAENMIPHELFRVVSRFPRYISCSIAENWFPCEPVCHLHQKQKIAEQIGECSNHFTYVYTLPLRTWKHSQTIYESTGRCLNQIYLREQWTIRTVSLYYNAIIDRTLLK